MAPLINHFAYTHMLYAVALLNKLTCTCSYICNVFPNA